MVTLKQTNQPAKRDGRVVAHITPLHNVDKDTAGAPIG